MARVPYAGAQTDPGYPRSHSVIIQMEEGGARAWKIK
jgi:hypothetical protein